MVHQSTNTGSFLLHTNHCFLYDGCFGHLSVYMVKLSAEPILSGRRG